MTRYRRSVPQAMSTSTNLLQMQSPMTLEADNDTDKPFESNYDKISQVSTFGYDKFNQLAPNAITNES